MEPTDEGAPGALDTLRSTLRTGVRAARRLAVGGRGLGPGAVVDWARHRSAGTEDAAVENSCLTWVCASAQRTTWVWLHNYWSDAYRIPRLEFAATLLDGHGHTVTSWEIDLDTDATELIDVRARLRRVQADLPFEGHLLLRTRDERLVRARPVQVFAEYLDDDGAATGVHGGYGLMDTPAAQIVGTMRVEPSPARTSVVVVNPYRGADDANRPMRAELTVWSHDGRRRTVRTAPVEPLASARVVLHDQFDGLDEFLDGRAGTFALTLPCPSSRATTLVEYPDGRWVADHGTIDRCFDQGRGTPRTHTSSWPVVSVLALVGAERDTVVSLPNRWGPVAESYEAHIVLRDGRGAVLTEAVRHVPKDALVEVSLGALLRDAGHPDVGVAHGEIRILPAMPVSELPATFDVLVALVDGGQRMAEVQVGSAFNNAAVPAGVAEAQVHRTRVFSRVRHNGVARTGLFLANPAGRDGYDHTAIPRVTLLDPTGRVCATTELAIAPHGFVWIGLDELFPEGCPKLGPTGWGALRIRDTGARLYGYHVVESAHSGSVVLDHLVGG